MKTVVAATDKFEILTFECRHCRKTIPYIDVVSSYGIVFLFGEHDGYYGSICPACQKMTLVYAEKDDFEIAELYKKLWNSGKGFFADNG